MTVVPFSALDQVARRNTSGGYDAGASRALQLAVEEYLARRRTAVADYSVQVDGKTYPSILAATLSDTPVDTIRVTFQRPGSGSPPALEFFEPIREVVLHRDGSAELIPAKGGKAASPVRAMARFLLREYFAPRPKGENRETAPHPWTDLMPLGELVQSIRTLGLVPFSLAALFYLSDRRSRYEVDLLDNGILQDFRAGHLPASAWVRRSSRVSFAVDRFVARSELPGPTARALEVLSETDGLTSVEVAQVLGGVRELANSALEVLHARGLTSIERRTGAHRLRLDAFVPVSGPKAIPSAPSPPSANPQLRSSVMELMAAAEARATCPLCGDPLPPGHQGLLCDRCSRLVEAGAG